MAFLGSTLVTRVQTFAGSLEALPEWCETSDADLSAVVVVATAAAYRGVDAAIDELRVVLPVPFTVVRGVDRSVLTDQESLAALEAASLLCCLDGSVLHARTLWRDTALGAVLRQRPLVAIGAVGSVFGDVMIDPRGGAPTVGMGCFTGVALAMATTPEQSTRTKTLLAPTCTLVELGPSSVLAYDGTWRVEVDGGVMVTRGGKPATL